MRWLSATLGLSLVLAATPLTSAEGVTPAGLSISIHDKSVDVRSDEPLAYVATVRNGGTATVEGRLVITVPTYVRITYSQGADQTDVSASWTVAVPAGGNVTKELGAYLGTIPKGELRVTTLVSFFLGDAKAPTIGSADANTIAGVTDPARAETGQTAAPPVAPAGLPMAWIAVGVLAVLAGIGVWWVTWRRRIRVRKSAEGT